MKASDLYMKKLGDEFSNLNFPYKPEVVSIVKQRTVLQTIWTLWYTPAVDFTVIFLRLNNPIIF